MVYFSESSNRRNLRQILRSKKNLILIAFAALLILTALTIWFINGHRAPNYPSTSPLTATGQQAPTPTKFSMRTLNMGDVFWGRYVDKYAQDSPLKYAYPFSNLHTFGRENYDAWIADMECPITDKYIPPATQEATLSFSCPKPYTKEAAKWFNAFTLANNHSSNRQDVDGFNQTKATLKDNGIQYFGHYDLAQKQDLCEIVGLPAKLAYSDRSVKTVTFPIALCGYHVLAGFPTKDELAQITKYSQYLPTWVYPHGGIEYTPAPPQNYIDLYRSMIDAGADVVLGDHPHWVQTSEAYKGKLIVYSVGNFIFDQYGAAFEGGSEVQRGAAIGVSISSNYDDNLGKLLAVGPECKVFKDDCLAKIISENLAKPKFSYSYAVTASDDSAKAATKKASLAWQDLVLKRLNWANTLKGLAPEI